MRSEEADQQRNKEARALKRFVGSSLLTSLLLHSIVLSLQSDNRWSLKPTEPTEVTIVPPELASPSPQALPSPEPVTPDPTNIPESLASDPPQPNPLTELEPQIRSLPQATAQPEGRPDVAANESPLVGSGLAEGTGGFSEGIGLNRSDSPIRGSGGGARQGVPGGDPDVVPASPVSPPPVAAPTPEPSEEDNSRWAVCRRCPAPDYPRAALQSGTEGRVRVTVDMDRRGQVTEVRLANSSGNAELDRSVLKTVREQWRFEAVAGGAENVPVEVYMTVNGSELNRQAETWGEQTSLEVPTTGFVSEANPASNPQTSAISAPTPLSEPPPESPQPAASTMPAAQSAPVSETSLETVPEPVEALPEEAPELVEELVPELVEELSETPIDLAPTDSVPTNSVPTDSAPLDLAPMNLAPIESGPVEGTEFAHPLPETVLEKSAPISNTD